MCLGGECERVHCAWVSFECSNFDDEIKKSPVVCERGVGYLGISRCGISPSLFGADSLAQNS